MPEGSVPNSLYRRSNDGLACTHGGHALGDRALKNVNRASGARQARGLVLCYISRMRNLRLLVLIGAFAAVGSYSALAVAGNAPRIGTSIGSHQANGGAGGPEALQEQQPEGDDAQGASKVAQGIADEFGVSQDEVIGRHNEGIGFGALFKLYKLARAQGISVDELLATVASDANGERDFAFGQRRNALTDEQRAIYDSGPKNLGRLVSGASKNAAAPEVEGAPEGGSSNGGGNGASGGAPGNGHVPPGQAKKATPR
jgi:hypothetical protein